MNPNAFTHLPIGSERRVEDRRHGPHLDPSTQLAELRQLDDYVIADGDPDIRGWEVRTAAGLGDRAVGCVEDLIVDRDTLQVRYLLVCLDRRAVATSRDRRVLVPVGVGRLDRHEAQVRLDGYSSAHLVGVPEFRPGHLTRRYEAIVCRRFAPPGPKAGPQHRPPRDFYAQGEYDERSLWASRRRVHADAPYLARHELTQ